jgi:hypothetical protein
MSVSGNNPLISIILYSKSTIGDALIGFTLKKSGLKVNKYYSCTEGVLHISSEI